LSENIESQYFLRIYIYNSNRESPLFKWIRGGNIALGIAVARKYVDANIPPKFEGKYQAYIKLTHDKSDSTVFKWEDRQGNVRLALNTLDEFTHQKLGFDITRQIQEANV